MTYIDQIDRKETVREAKRHLEKFHQFCKIDGIVDFVKVSGGIISTISSNGNSTTILDAMAKNDQRTDYIKWILEYGINKLDAEERKLLLLKYFYGKSELDIAESVNQHETTVRKKISQACFNFALFLRLEIIKANLSETHPECN